MYNDDGLSTTLNYNSNQKKKAEYIYDYILVNTYTVTYIKFTRKFMNCRQHLRHIVTRPPVPLHIIHDLYYGVKMCEILL